MPGHDVVILHKGLRAFRDWFAIFTIRIAEAQ